MGMPGRAPATLPGWSTRPIWAPVVRARAKQLVADLWTTGSGCLSNQVLQEFYVAVIQKVRRPLKPEIARQHVEDLGQWLIHAPTARVHPGFLAGAG
jgi:hypothetical protein